MVFFLLLQWAEGCTSEISTTCRLGGLQSPWHAKTGVIDQYYQPDTTRRDTRGRENLTCTDDVGEDGKASTRYEQNETELRMI